MTDKISSSSTTQYEYSMRLVEKSKIDIMFWRIFRSKEDEQRKAEREELVHVRLTLKERVEELEAKLKEQEDKLNAPN